MSVFESRELDVAGPVRARSLLTVRAAISSARSSERPCSRSLALMCSYLRASFVPFFTPRGGISTSSSETASVGHVPGEQGSKREDERVPGGIAYGRIVDPVPVRREAFDEAIAFGGVGYDDRRVSQRGDPGRRRRRPR